jgi:eukaryotic-like serine/threonine-protein kinase
VPKSIVIGQTDKARIEMEVVGERATVRPVGIVDEDIGFAVIFDTLRLLGVPLKSLVFDLGSIERMNSSGVREWLLLHEKMPKSIVCTFVNVSLAMIEQAGVIPGILGQKELAVLSFQAPYYCAGCKEDLSILLEVKDVVFDDGKPVAPAHSCPKCSSPLRFDWLEEEYFSFLKRPKRPVTKG